MCVKRVEGYAREQLEEGCGVAGSYIWTEYFGAFPSWAALAGTPYRLARYQRERVIIMTVFLPHVNIIGYDGLDFERKSQRRKTV